MESSADIELPSPGQESALPQDLLSSSGWEEVGNAGGPPTGSTDFEAPEPNAAASEDVDMTDARDAEHVERVLAQPDQGRLFLERRFHILTFSRSSWSRSHGPR